MKKIILNNVAGIFLVLVGVLFAAYNGWKIVIPQIMTPFSVVINFSLVHDESLVNSTGYYDFPSYDAYGEDYYSRDGASYEPFSGDPK